MFKEVTGIKVTGGCYTEEGTDLEGILSQRLNIVYGRNGSGKTTLAKAIYGYAHDVQDPKFGITFSPEVDEEARKMMFVFGEDFVMDNVKLAKGGLEAIVMIGEQVDIGNREEVLEAEKTRKEGELAAETGRYDTAKATHVALHDRLLKSLKDRYAEREREFRKMARKPSVADSIIQDIETLYGRLEDKPTDMATLMEVMKRDTDKILSATGAEKVAWYSTAWAMPDAMRRCSGFADEACGTGGSEREGPASDGDTGERRAAALCV
jgi:energy-coupling factor transporter ATP-binding protein EcfA2